MEESQESKDVIIPLLMLMNMPEETICELFRTEKNKASNIRRAKTFYCGGCFYGIFRNAIDETKGNNKPFLGNKARYENNPH